MRLSAFPGLCNSAGTGNLAVHKVHAQVRVKDLGHQGGGWTNLFEKYYIVKFNHFSRYCWGENFENIWVATI